MVRTMPAAQETELERLEKENRQLNDQVVSQAWELSLLRARFARYDTALRGSQVTGAAGRSPWPASAPIWKFFRAMAPQL